MKNRKYVFLLVLISTYSTFGRELFQKKQLDSVLAVNYTLEKMSMNTHSDNVGAFEQNGTIYFSSNKVTRRVKQWIHSEDDTYVFNMYAATKHKEEGYKKSLLKGDVNTKLNQSFPVITKDGTTMYFTSNVIKAGVFHTELHILKATKENGSWTHVTDLPINNISHSNAHGVLNADETLLYFVSDRKNNTGDSDIYKVQLFKDGTYGVPERLGDNINTLKEEKTPFITQDNGLYFSSKGHPGLGGFDVFYVDLNDENATPINLGPAINTQADDFGFSMHVPTGKGFVTSNKEGTHHLYRVTEKNPLNEQLKKAGLLKSSGTTSKKNGLDAKTIGASAAFMAALQDSTNTYSEEYQLFFKALQSYIGIKERDKLNKIAKAKVSKLLDSLFNLKEVPVMLEMLRNANEATSSSPYSTSSSSSSPAFSDDRKRVGYTSGQKKYDTQEVVLDYFDLNSSYFHPLFKQKLTALSWKLINNRRLHVEFHVHADARGTNAYNMMLSEKRLKRIENYLIKKGVYYYQVSGNAYGQNLILNECGDGVFCEEDLHRLNRRVTYKFIQK